MNKKQLQELGSSFPILMTTSLLSPDDFKDKKALLVAVICRHCPYVQHVKTALAQLGADYAGKNMANPLASILSIAMMMETSFELHEIAREIEQAVRDVLRAGHRTADIAEPGQRCVSCSEIGDLVCGRIGK